MVLDFADSWSPWPYTLPPSPGCVSIGKESSMLLLVKESQGKKGNADNSRLGTMMWVCDLSRGETEAEEAGGQHGPHSKPVSKDPT